MILSNHYDLNLSQNKVYQRKKKMFWLLSWNGLCRSQVPTACLFPWFWLVPVPVARAVHIDIEFSRHVKQNGMENFIKTILWILRWTTFSWTAFVYTLTCRLVRFIAGSWERNSVLSFYINNRFVGERRCGLLENVRDSKSIEFSCTKRKLCFLWRSIFFFYYKIKKGITRLLYYCL